MGVELPSLAILAETQNLEARVLPGPFFFLSLFFLVAFVFFCLLFFALFFFFLFAMEQGGRPWHGGRTGRQGTSSGKEQHGMQYNKWTQKDPAEAARGSLK